MPVLLAVILHYVIYGLLILIVADVIISNLSAAGQGPSAYSPGVRMLRKIVNPMLDPFRRMLPPSRTGGWDFSPVFAMLILSMLQAMLLRMH